MSLYIMSQNFGQCPFWLEKKQVKCCTGGHESVHISVIARVRNNESTFESFLHAFRGGGGGGLVLGVSVMVRCPYKESRLST